MVPQWLYLIGSLCFLIGTVWGMAQSEPSEEDDEEQEEVEPFGFQVKDSGVVDGGEPDWEGWSD